MRFFLIAIIFGIIFTWFSISDISKYSKLKADGVTTDGIIVHQERGVGRRNRTYKITVNFTPAGANPVAVPVEVTSEYFKQTAYGDACEVVYLPSDPTIAIIVEKSRDGSGMIWIGLVALAIGVGGVGLSFLGKSRRTEE